MLPKLELTEHKLGENGAWYYRMEDDGILFPTFFETYYTTKGITPVDFVYDKEIGFVKLDMVSGIFNTFDTKHKCISIFLMEQWDRGHYMHHWDLHNEYQRELFEIFMDTYAHMILVHPEEGANKMYIYLENELHKYKEEK